MLSPVTPALKRHEALEVLEQAFVPQGQDAGRNPLGFKRSGR
jgi:hypothetical protein